MSRIAIRAGIACVAALVAGIVHFTNKSSSSDQFRHKSHVMIRTVQGYDVKPDYYDWLVDEAHDEVFDESYHTERRGRYSEKAWVDRNEYLDSLFASMITLAEHDNATGVVESLKKFQGEHSH